MAPAALRSSPCADGSAVAARRAAPRSPAAPARPLPRVGGAPSSRAATPGTSAWTGCPCIRTRTRSCARSAAARHMHADFGSGLWDGGPIGIPFVTVRRAPAAGAGELRLRRRVRPRPATRSRATRPIEGGRGADGDRHVIVVDRARCRLYELFAAYPRAAARAGAPGSGAIWNLRSNRLRPRGWTSADAAGPADPARPGPLRRGQARPHRPRPALHRAAHAARLRLPGAPLRLRPRPTRTCRAMGQRLRLKRGFDISRFPRQARIVLRALKRYGMILADNGSSWYVSGAPDRGWRQRPPPHARPRAGQRLRGRPARRAE